MSQIGPVQRNPLLNTANYARLNEPAPVLDSENVSRVDPVKSSNRDELLEERREINPEVDAETDRLVFEAGDRDRKKERTKFRRYSRQLGMNL